MYEFIFARGKAIVYKENDPRFNFAYWMYANGNIDNRQLCDMDFRMNGVS